MTKNKQNQEKALRDQKAAQQIAALKTGWWIHNSNKKSQDGAVGRPFRHKEGAEKKAAMLGGKEKGISVFSFTYTPECTTDLNPDHFAD